MEGPKAAAGVVEDAIQHHLDAAGVRLIQQGAQPGVAAQQGVHLVIIKGVVAVVGGRGEDGVQVQRGHAQFLQVAQLIGDAV